MASTFRHCQPPKKTVPVGMSGEWCRMMAGTASAGIGLVQLLCSVWVGGFFSLFLAGELWSGVALRKAKRNLDMGWLQNPPHGLVLSHSVFLGCTVLQGLRLFLG